MTVTKLTQSKNVPGRWYIDLDNGDSLKIDTNIIADYGIYTGRELSEEEYQELRDDSSAASARSRALRMVGARAMSRKELTGKLLEKGETERDAEAAADRMEAIGAINDREYAGMIVRHCAAKGWGKRRIQDELYRRGVPKELWDGALEQLPEQDDAVDRYITLKLRGSLPDQKELKRVTDGLSRRGYSWTEIREGLERYKNSLGENTDEY